MRDASEEWCDFDPDSSDYEEHLVDSKGAAEALMNGHAIEVHGDGTYTVFVPKGT